MMIPPVQMPPVSPWGIPRGMMVPSPPAPQPMPFSPGSPWGVTPAAPIRATDPVIVQALRILEQTENLPQDEAYLQSIGINIIFRNGREALDVIRQRNASVEFGDTGDPSAHAVWDQQQNKMIINHRYRGNMSLPVLYAIAASIYHEAGHAARLGDNVSSIQEELDCLALNSMAYRSHAARDPRYLTATSSGPLRALFENGVALYPKLFFDPDPYKRRLVNRVIEKYGMLPPESPDHPIPQLSDSRGITERILYEIQRRNTQVAFGQQQIRLRQPQAPSA